MSPSSGNWKMERMGVKYWCLSTFTQLISDKHLWCPRPFAEHRGMSVIKNGQSLLSTHQESWRGISHPSRSSFTPVAVTNTAMKINWGNEGFISSYNSSFGSSLGKSQSRNSRQKLEYMPNCCFTQHDLKRKNSLHSQRRVAGTTEGVTRCLAGRLIYARLAFFDSSRSLHREWRCPLWNGPSYITQQSRRSQHTCLQASRI